MASNRLEVLQKIIFKLQASTALFSDPAVSSIVNHSVIDDLNTSVLYLQNIDDESPLIDQKNNLIERLIENAYKVHLLLIALTSKDESQRQSAERSLKKFSLSNFALHMGGDKICLQPCIDAIKRFSENIVLKQKLIDFVSHSQDVRVQSAQEGVYDLIRYYASPAVLNATYDFLQDQEFNKYGNVLDASIVKDKKIQSATKWIVFCFIIPAGILVAAPAGFILGIAALFNQELRLKVKTEVRKIKHIYAEYKHRGNRLEHFQTLKQSLQAGHSFFQSEVAVRSSAELTRVQRENPLASSRIVLNAQREIVENPDLASVPGQNGGPRRR